MDARLKPIFARRSVRSFKNQPLTDETVHALLEAGMAAPSAVARDPWRFVVVREKDTMNRLIEKLPNGHMLPKAGVGIVVCGDMDSAHDRQLSYMLQDCSACIENMLLAASMLGLGGVWLGVHPREERMIHVREVLGIPESITPIAVLAIGVPAEERAPRTRYSDAHVHMEKW